MCRVVQTVTGATATAVLAASSLTPVSVTVASNTSALVIVADAFVAGAPGTDPSPSILADGGMVAAPPWVAGAVLVLLGAVTLEPVAARRRPRDAA